MNDKYADTQGSPVMMFIAGAVVGAGIALLLAPASGEDTRRRLGETARKFKDETKNRVAQARDTLTELKEDAKSAIETGRETFTQGRRQRSEQGSYADSGSPSRTV